MSLSIFKRRAPPLVGMDISSSSVKVVELSDAGKQGHRIERYAVLALPPNTFEDDGKIANPEALTEVIQKGLRREGFRIKQVAIGMPSAQVMRKVEAVNAELPPDALDSEIQTRITESIAYSIDEAYYDYRPLGEIDPVNNETQYLIVATRRDAMDDRSAVIEAAGLRVAIVDTAEIAIRAAFAEVLARSGADMKDRNVVLIKLGASQTTLLLIRNDDLLYAKEVPIGGNSLRSDIVNAYGKTFEQAERIMRGEEPEPDGYRNSMLNPFIDQCASEVQRLLQVFSASLQQGAINDVYLCGGCALLDGLVNGMNSRLSLPVRIADPTDGLPIAPGVSADDLRRDGPSLLTAYGLAMRRFG